MPNRKNELDSFERIFKELSLFGFLLNWKGTSQSWELDHELKLSVDLEDLLKESISSLNWVDRESSYHSLTISSQSIHCNYFIVKLKSSDKHVCMGIVTATDSGARPSSLKCMVYLEK